MTQHRSFRLTPLEKEILPGTPESPTCLSCGGSFFVKRVFPTMVFGIAAVYMCLILYICITQQKPLGELAMFLLPPLAIVAWFVVYLKRVILAETDDVWDAGSHLIVRFSGQEDRIPIENIDFVTYYRRARRRRVEVHLRRPSRFGEMFFFTPRQRFPCWSEPAFVRDLNHRVDAVLNQSSR